MIGSGQTIVPVRGLTDGDRPGWAITTVLLDAGQEISTRTVMVKVHGFSRVHAPTENLYAVFDPLIFREKGERHEPRLPAHRILWRLDAEYGTC